MKGTARRVSAAVLAGALVLPALAQQVPTTSPEPLSRMPYSPSLDVTSLDRTADPCVDFYRFSCGGWQKKNPIPADQAGWNVYAKLANDNRQYLWGILAQDAKPEPGRTTVQQKVGDYFESCMNTPAIDAAGKQPLQTYLAKVDALRTRSEIAGAIAMLQRELPGDYFLNAGTQQDAVNSSLMIATVQAGGLGLPDRDYYDRTDPKSVEIRDQYQAYVAQMLVLGGEQATQAKADAGAILGIETALARASLTRAQRRDPHNVYHPMTVEQLSALTPAIAWPDFFAQHGAPGTTKLSVSEPEFMKALQIELSTRPEAELRTYLRFHVLSDASPFLAEPFRQASFAFYSHTLRGVPAEPPRWKRCVRGVDDDLGEALGQEFVARTFSAEMKARTERMTAQIEAAMQHEIETLDWMGPETKQEALRKLHAIRNKIGYPEHWRDYSTLQIKPDDYFGNVVRAYAFEDARQWHKLGKPVDLLEWGMTAPTVNAYFNAQMNDVNFPAGVLQPPLYDAKLDDAPNYGNTGATIGHELTHAFDDQGRQFDAAGNLRDWWTAADAARFEDRINCIRSQYAGYVVVDDIHINSKLTSGEDVADLGGTLLAYIAWQQQTAGKQLESQEGFTPDQRFFVGMAQWACGNERPENLRVQAITDPHSPLFARINGVVSNMPQFQSAFGCKAGQPMVHAPTCKVW